MVLELLRKGTPLKSPSIYFAEIQSIMMLKRETYIRALKQYLYSNKNSKDLPVYMCALIEQSAAITWQFFIE